MQSGEDNFAPAAHFFCIFFCRCFARLQRETSRNFLVTFWMEEMSYVFSFTFFHGRSFSPCIWLVAASISLFVTAATKFSCCCFMLHVSGEKYCMCSCPPFFHCRPFSLIFFSHRRYKIFMFFFQQKWSLLFFISFSSSSSMKTLKLSGKKESAMLLLLLFISESPGAYAIYCRNARVLEMQNFTPVYMKGILTYGRTDDFRKPGFR